MVKLHFDYKMEIAYSYPAGKCYYTIKCIPQDTDRQRVTDLKITIEPGHTESFGTDSFGNRQIYGMIPEDHDHFSYHIEGDLQTDVDPLIHPWEEKADELSTFLYKRSYGMNKSGEGLRAYFARIREELKAGSDYETAKELMHCLHRDFSYVPGQTGIETTAEEAWSLGGGVCQDYTHIFTALCHLAKIPCRYVTGMIEGEGASHAWAEVLCDGRWFGFDPTNDLLVCGRHIKIGHGRDAHDCKINRGVMQGGGAQTQTISVSVYESESCISKT